MAFLRQSGQLLPGEECVEYAQPGRTGSHLLVTTHRLILANSTPGQPPVLVAIDDAHQLEFSITLRLQGQRLYEVDGLCPQDVIRIQDACQLLAPVTGLQRVREVLAHLGLEPDSGPDSRITSTPRGPVLELLGRRFAFDPLETPRHHVPGGPHGY